MIDDIIKFDCIFRRVQLSFYKDKNKIINKETIIRKVIDFFI